MCYCIETREDELIFVLQFVQNHKCTWVMQVVFGNFCDESNASHETCLPCTSFLLEVVVKNVVFQKMGHQRYRQEWVLLALHDPACSDSTVPEAGVQCRPKNTIGFAWLRIKGSPHYRDPPKKVHSCTASRVCQHLWALSDPHIFTYLYMGL